MAPCCAGTRVIAVRFSLGLILSLLLAGMIVIAFAGGLRQNRRQVDPDLSIGFRTKTDGDWEITSCFNLLQILYAPRTHRMVLSPVSSAPELWDTMAGRRIAILQESDLPIEWTAISPDETMVLTAERISKRSGSRDDEKPVRRIWCWDLIAGGLISKLEIDLSEHYLVNMDWRINWLDSNRLLVQLNNRESSAPVPYRSNWLICDIRNRAIVKRISHGAFGDVGEKLVFSPNRSRAVATFDYSFLRGDHGGVGRGGRGVAYSTHLVDLLDGDVISVLNGFDLDAKGELPKIGLIKWSGDSLHIASVRDDHVICIFDASFGQPVSRLAGHKSWVLDVDFSSDGKRLVSSSDDGTAKVWNIESGECIANLIGHSEGLNCALFDDSGSYVLTGSEDKTAILWDAGFGKLVKRFGPHEGAVRHVSFDGKDTVTTRTEGGVQRTWRTTGELISTVQPEPNVFARWDSCEIRKDWPNHLDIWVRRRN